MGFRAAALPLSLAALLAATACRDPTEARVILSTDALCADVRETSITSASDPSELEGRAPLAVTQACDAGSIGDLVLVPSDDKDAPFTVRVVTGLNKSADDCIADGYMGGCIVARRSLRFLPHRSIRLPIELEVACRDVPCDATQTCRHGSCVSASIDPGQCAGSDSCDVVDPGSGEAGAGGAGSDGGSAGASTNGGEGGAAGAPSDGGDDGGAAGAAGATPLGVCGDGHLADGEACDDGNAKPGDGCVGCKIAPDWGCRDEPSQCSQVAQLKLTIDGPDDLPDDALDRVFTPLPDERSYIYVGIDAPSPNGFEYCLARADWYAQNYLAYADSDLNVPSGTWDKWYRSPGEGWVADTSCHVNYFGNACEPGGRSLCIEWMLGEQLIGFQPAYTNGGEVFSNGYSDANSHWKTSLRVGPTRQSACGF